MSLPTITATGRLIDAPEVRHDGAGVPVLRLRLVCEDGPRVTHLSVDLAGPEAEALCRSLADGDTVQATGRLVNRRTRAGHRLYALQATALHLIDHPAVAR